MTLAPARRSALGVLARIRRDSAFSGAALSAALSGGGLSPEDIALVTRLVYGVVAAEGVLDEAIDRHVSRTLEPRLRDVLRLGAYEILFSEEPAYAVVDQTVTAARLVRPQAAGLANAVMRRVATDAPGFPWGDPDTDRDALSRLAACPRWITDVFLRSLGAQAGREALLAGVGVAPTYVRLDPFASSVGETLERLGAACPEVAPPDESCFLLARPAAAFSAGDRHGWFPMDAAAQMAPLLCSPAPGEAVLDVGAGRGNKTVCLQSLAVRAGGSALITALEVSEGKTRRLGERLERSGVPDVAIVCGDASAASTTFGSDSFDVVLLDAPCTGLGTLRRYPEKRWRLAPGDIDRMSRLQQDMLVAVAPVVRPAGRLVYSTCSVSTEENRGVIDAFLSGPQGHRFELVRVDEHVPKVWERFIDGVGSFQAWPTPDGPDGHYVAVLRCTSA